MMEAYSGNPRIGKMEAEKDRNTGLIAVHAILRCTRKECRRIFQFNFNAKDADIVAMYRWEDIAERYIERCAPLLCPGCQNGDRVAVVGEGINV